MPKAKNATSKALALSHDPAITALKTRTTKLLKSWQEIDVKNTLTFEAAGIALKAAVDLRKDLKALPVWVELKAAKADLKAKEKYLKDIDGMIERTEYAMRWALTDYTRTQREAQEKLITKALDAGKDEKAANLMAKPFIPEVSGLSFTDHWHAEITSMDALLKAVASGKVSQEAIIPNFVYLNLQARLDHGMSDLWNHGVKAVKETSSTVRT